jgi:hypothetical protein
MKRSERAQEVGVGCLSALARRRTEAPAREWWPSASEAGGRGTRAKRPHQPLRGGGVAGAADAGVLESFRSRNPQPPSRARLGELATARTHTDEPFIKLSARASRAQGGIRRRHAPARHSLRGVRERARSVPSRLRGVRPPAPIFSLLGSELRQIHLHGTSELLLPRRDATSKRRRPSSQPVRARGPCACRSARLSSGLLHHSRCIPQSTARCSKVQTTSADRLAAARHVGGAWAC